MKFNKYKLINLFYCLESLINLFCFEVLEVLFLDYDELYKIDIKLV